MLKKKPVKKAKQTKSKVPSTKKLVKELDKVFGDYIVNRDNWTCITCGKKIVNDRKKIQCGHYISRKHYATRWDERNCSGQCIGCNVFGNGRPDDYAIKIIEKYGMGVLKELNRLKYSNFKLSTAWLLDKIAFYKNK